MPPTAATIGRTASDVLDGIDLTGRRALVTDGSSLLGEETARALASAGAEVTLAAKHLSAGYAAGERMHASAGRIRTHVVELDLMSPRSVAAAAAGWTGPLDILAAKSGAMAPPRGGTAGGWESHFMTSRLGNFGLMTRLWPALAAAGDARVVLAGSNAHVLAPVDEAVVDDREMAYEPWSALRGRRRR